MSVFESFFGKLHRWVKDSEQQRRSGYILSFDEMNLSLVTFAQGSMQTDQTPLHVKPYDGFGGVYGHSLLLPKEFGPFNDSELNRSLFLHKAISGGVLRRLGIYSQANQKSCVQRAFEIALLRPIVVNGARQIFPEYESWSSEIFEKLELACEGEMLSGVDRAWLRVEARFKSHLEESLGREPPSRKTLEALEGLLSPQLVRELDQLPMKALAPWCEPIMEQVLFDGAEVAEPSRARSEKTETEKEGRSASEIEVVDLEKERNRENPVSHSFEKMETADEYKGGYKDVDGSDQLNEHQNALDELRLNKVTRGGEAASSSYRSDISELIRTPESAIQSAKPIEHRYYPEWDYQRKTMRDQYCRLYCEKPEPPQEAKGDAWLAQVMTKHQQGLDQWKHRLSMLVNQRRWRDRQWEGNEISIDAFVRYWGDTRFSGAGDARLYVKNFAAMRDFSCLVLIDQSFSTDSWVNNRRVIDIELESLALVSELLAPLREPVAVAGTWSETRNHCHFRLYKDFEDPWSSLIQHAPLIVPQGYTRLGPAIRHSTQLLSKQSARHKLLILLTDGKPTDYDRYEGRYGIEDIHHACLEATQKGIALRALAIEKEAKNYFPHLFGAREYQILQNPEELPEQLFRIYLETIRA